jgi:hypothetical protein
MLVVGFADTAIKILFCKGKFSLCLTQHLAMKTCGGVVVYIDTFLSSLLQLMAALPQMEERSLTNE